MKCFRPFTVTRERNQITLPCGKCPACRANKADTWAARCIIEKQHSKQSHFITLTYNEDFLPTDEDGFHPVSKKELQNFFKRLRKKMSFRYFACGEYGDENYRPHYHILLFINHSTYDYNELYHIIKNSWAAASFDTTNKIYNYNLFGNIQIKPMEHHSIRYVVRYFINKNTFIDKQYSTINKQHPFILISRKPAIGYQLTENFTKFMYSLLDGYIMLDKKYPLSDYYTNYAKTFYYSLYNSIKKIKETQKLTMFTEAIASGKDLTKQFVDMQKALQGKYKNLTFRQSLL